MNLKSYYIILTKVIEEKAHILHNKNIDPKRAMVRGGRSDACKKVFVGGVSPEMPESEIREYFGKFGKVFKNFFIYS